MRQACLTVVFLLALVQAGFTQDFRGIDNRPPSPTLLSPAENVDLGLKASLKFQWYGSDSSAIDHYEFRLYKGYANTGDNLIFKQDLDAMASTVEVKSDLFEVGQVYTWGVRAISRSGRKSDPCFSTFTVVKK
jgi:hypothetical protein